MSNRFYALPCFLLVLLAVGCRPDTDRSSPISVRKESPVVDSSFVRLSETEKESLRDSLLAVGEYDCCTKPGCFQCIEEKGGCSCYQDLKKKDPICGQCLEGYKNGEGKLKLVSIPELEQIRSNRKRLN